MANRGLHPLAGLEEICIQPCLRCPGPGAPVVAPAYRGRQRHQYGLGAPARLPTEQRTAVVHQIELDVAPAPVGLKIALTLRVGELPAALCDRHPCVEEMIAHAAHQGKREFKAAVAQVVEKYSADAARLRAVLDV